MVYDLIIIGAGAAGLFAGSRAAAAGLSFCVLEKMNQAGLKLLTTGSGQCNLTNTEDIRLYPERYGRAFRFVRPALMEWTNRDLIDFFEEQGLPCEDRGDGKVFPVSRRSRDVRDLLQKLTQQGGRIFWKDPVRNIRKENSLFIIRCEKDEYRARRVLLASGGQSYPGTGSTGDSYPLAESLGHSLVTPRPALTAVTIKQFSLSASSGTALPVILELYREGRKLWSRQGDLLITHRGFSGPVILNNSRDMALGDTIRISWLPGCSRKELEQDSLERCRKWGKRSLLSGLKQNGIPEGLMTALIERAGLNPGLKLNQLNRKSRAAWMDEIIAASFIIESPGGFNQAMVTAGGVSLKEVNPKTMESRLCSGFYLAGEALDVDGETGGYNLQFAFSSAALAVKSMAED